MTKKTEVSFHAGGDEKASLAMEKWLRELDTEARGKISWNRADAGQGLPLPSFSLKGKGSSEIHYHFVPEGPEETAFQDLLRQAPGPEEALAEKAHEQEGRPETVEMLLFVSNHCPNCPRAVGTIHALCLELPWLSAHILEATLCPELAEQYHIQSVPTLIMEKEIRYVGDLEKEQLASVLGNWDSESLVQELIRQHIRESRAPEAANLIAKGANPAFLALDLAQSTFQDRIGLLFAMEEALEIDPRCLDSLVPGLMPILAADHAPLRGDVADLLGKIGHPDAVPALKPLHEDPDPDVAEAAEEALDMILKGDN